jgi:hypothetical protein
MQNISEDIEDIIRTLAHILREKGNELPVRILTNSTIDIRETNYDNWNGGTFGYTIDLRIPVRLYASLQDNLETIEKDLLSKIKPLTRAYENEYIENVLIAPKLIKDSSDSNGALENEVVNIDSIKFWERGYFRLFLSHSSKNKVHASHIQKASRKFAISVFVAHEDIEPTKEWQNEIELALSSMDSLAALLTDDFKDSKWCDQEVGIAIGRKVLIIPIRSGIDPYGFVGKYQGVAANKKTPEDLCEEIFKILLKNDQTKSTITNAIVHKISNSESFAESKDTVALLKNASDNITPEMKDKLVTATKVNRQVYDSFGVVDRIKTIINQQS